MKKLFSLLLILFLLASFAGCRAIHQAEEYIDHKLDTAENAVEAVVREAIAPAPETPAPAERPAAPQVPAYDPPAAEPSVNLLAKEEAEAIVLEHAGLTADQLLYLRTELDYDNGCRKYDIEFQIDRWEYDYELHAETGEILSWDKDWDD